MAARAGAEASLRIALASFLRVDVVPAATATGARIFGATGGNRALQQAIADVAAGRAREASLIVPAELLGRAAAWLPPASSAGLLAGGPAAPDVPVPASASSALQALSAAAALHALPLAQFCRPLSAEAAAAAASTVVAPSLPGTGGSIAERAWREASGVEGGDDSVHTRDAGECAEGVGDSPAGGGTRGTATQLLPPAHAALLAACAAGACVEVLDSLRSGACGGVEGVHHPEHGATPLHLLVSSPAALEEDERAAAAAAARGAASAGGATKSEVLPLLPPRGAGPGLSAVPAGRAGEDADTAESPFAAAVRALVEAGCGVNEPAANGSTPLHWAAGAGARGACALLLELGADPQARSYTWRRQTFGVGSGQTPLHWAAESNHPAVVRLLVEACPAALGATDERGRTARDAAEKQISVAAVRALEAVAGRQFVALRVSLEGAGARMM